MKIAAGHAWNVWPDPEPETVAAEGRLSVPSERLLAVLKEKWPERGRRQMRAVVESWLPEIELTVREAVEAEAAAAALAALREWWALWDDVGPESGKYRVGRPLGTIPGDMRERHETLLAAPLSVREPDPGIRWCGDTEPHKPHLMAPTELRCPGDPWWAGSLLPTPVREPGLDVERLDRSMAAAGVHVDKARPGPTREIGCQSCREGIAAIAAEYARLAPERPADERGGTDTLRGLGYSDEEIATGKLTKFRP